MTSHRSQPSHLTRRTVLGSAAAVPAAAALLGTDPASAEPRAVMALTERSCRGVALTGVTVIDPGTRTVRPHVTVSIRDGSISTIHRGNPPEGMRVVDLAGAFVIPGLADMHAHAQAEGIDPALNIANGVTTVRDMAGSPLARDWRDRIQAGTLLGPRYVLGSRIIDGKPSIWDPAIVETVQVANRRQARAAVRAQHRAGYDFVKVYSRVPREAYRALAAEAERIGIPFAGHCPDEVPLAEAARLGQTSVEHLFWTPLETTSREAELRAKIARLRLELGDYSGWFNAIHRIEWAAVNSLDPARARRLHHTLARHHTRQVPTLAMHHGLDHARTLDIAADPRNRYLPPALVQGMKYALEEFYLKDRAPADDASWAAMFEHRLTMVKQLHDHDVPIMTGTDTGTVALYPGFSVHDELALLVQAGLPPMDALRAATHEPARCLRTNTGRIAPGAAADLLVLRKNPLTDIHHTTSIQGVVAAGRWIDNHKRHNILREVEHVAAHTESASSRGA